MSDLKSRLAARLHDVFMHGPEKTSMWGDVAEECIRQMEWARTECVGERWGGDGRDGTRHIVDRSERLLTLAPEDWKP